jgi:hypothetical protein
MVATGSQISIFSEDLPAPAVNVSCSRVRGALSDQLSLTSSSIHVRNINVEIPYRYLLGNLSARFLKSVDYCTPVGVGIEVAYMFFFDVNRGKIAGIGLSENLIKECQSRQ